MNIKNLILTLALALFFSAFQQMRAQEIGYLTGVSRMGINPQKFEPIYGFSLGVNVNRVIAIETSFFYSQRTIGSIVQADYFSFAVLPKIGYFWKKAGAYYVPGLSLNPTLYHSNPENHTYLSTLQLIGGEFYVTKSIIMDLKAGYDFGLTGAYFENEGYNNYNGPILLLGIKYTVKGR